MREKLSLSGVLLLQIFPKAQRIYWSFPLNLSSSSDSTLSIEAQLIGGASPVLAAFVVASVHLHGLEGGAMAFVWVPWPLGIQTEN